MNSGYTGLRRVPAICVIFVLLSVVGSIFIFFYALVVLAKDSPGVAITVSVATLVNIIVTWLVGSAITDYVALQFEIRDNLDWLIRHTGQPRREALSVPAVSHPQPE